MKLLRNRSLILCLVCSGFATQMPQASASPLGLDLEDTPEFFTSFIQVTYDAATDQLSMLGFPGQFDPGDGNPPITLDQSLNLFTLNAEILADGSLIAGQLTFLSGELFAATPSAPIIVLEGDLGDIGFDTSNQELEFTFFPTGGPAASLFSASSSGIIINNTGLPNTNAFTSNWTNVSNGQGNGFANLAPLTSDAVIPEPAGYALFVGIALIGFIFIKRKIL